MILVPFRDRFIFGLFLGTVLVAGPAGSECGMGMVEQFAQYGSTSTCVAEGAERVQKNKTQRELRLKQLQMERQLRLDRRRLQVRQEWIRQRKIRNALR